MRRKKFIPVLFLIISLLSSPMAIFAQNGPNLSADSSAESYVSLLETDGTPTDLFYAQGGALSNVSQVDGASYDQNTNTLTLTDFSSTQKLECSMMGDDFTIQLKGQNSIGQISVFGDGYGGSLKIKGTGSLTVNSAKSYTDVPAILLRADGAASTFTLSGKATVTLYGTDSVGTLAVISTKTSDPAAAIHAGLAKSEITSASNSDSTYDYRLKSTAVTLKNTSTLPKTALTSVKGKKKAIFIKWKKISSAASYQVQISKNANFKNAKTKKFKGNSATATKLSAKTTYYVRVRCLATVNGKQIFSAWSAKKAVTTK